MVRTWTSGMRSMPALLRSSSFREKLTLFARILLLAAFTYILLTHVKLAKRHQPSSSIRMRQLSKWVSNPGTFIGNSSRPSEGNVYILKIPKSGSSTLSHIFLKRAWWKHQRVATYFKEPVPDDPAVMTRPGPLVTNLIPSFNEVVSERYNLITEHSVFVKKDAEKVLEHPITYITIIRNPFSRFRSTFYTSPHLQKAASKIHGDLAQTFLKSYKEPGWMEKVGLRWSDFDRFWLTYFLNANRSVDQEVLLKALKRVKKDFVVLLADEYEMSLVLLRRKLKLSFGEILSIPIRITIYGKEVDVTKTDKPPREYCELAPNDCFVYSHLATSFWHTVKQQPDDFFSEVAYYKKTLKRVVSYCKRVTDPMVYATKHKEHFKLSEHKPSNLKIGRSKWSEPFEFTPEECLYLLLSEKCMYPLFFFRQNAHINCENLENCPYPRTELWMCKMLCRISKNTTSAILEKLAENARNYIIS